jgi:hypothetical protein
LPTGTEATRSSNPSSTGFTTETEKDDTDKHVTSQHPPDDSALWGTNSDKYQKASMTSDTSPVHSCEDTDTEVERACQNKSQSPISSVFYGSDAFQSADSPIFSAESLLPSPDPSHFTNAVNDITYEEESAMLATGISNGQSSLNFNTHGIYFGQHQGHPGKLHLDFLPAPTDQKELIHH